MQNGSEAKWPRIKSVCGEYSMHHGSLARKPRAAV